MIPVQSHVRQTDTLPGTEVAFTIGDPRWVMQSLSDLYSNKELAVAREYSTNARDAMIEAGKSDQAIEVTLPSMMHPYFKVRDYGPGMSSGVLTEVYTSFGRSTKRDSNDFNGVLGFGSKSAVAYTDNFTVSSICNGIKNVAVITRKPDFSIVMKIVSSRPTTEASGTEIVVPVHNWQEFAHKAKDFYKFWKPGTVLVNGEFPSTEVGEKLTDDLYYSVPQGWNSRGQSFVVMGNVGYRITNSDALFRDSRLSTINFVAYVDNGAVEFTPSREDLKYTDVTRNTLRNVVRDFENKIIAQAQDDINSAKTHAEAYDKWSDWSSKLGRALFSDLTFNGDTFKDDFNIQGWRYQPHASSYGTQRISKWSVSSASSTLFITGFEPVGLTTTHKAKAREYMSAFTSGLVNRNYRYVIFTNDTITSPWVNTKAANFVKWDALVAALPKKPKKPRAVVTKPGRIPGTFDYWTRNGLNYEQEIPANVTVYYARIKEVKPKGEYVVNFKGILDLMNDNGVVVMLAANRIDKFVRDNPTAIDFLPHYRSKVVTDGKTLLSDDAKKMLAYGQETKDWLRKLDVSRLDDPEFAKAAALVAKEDELLSAYQTNMSLAFALNMRYNVSSHGISAVDDSLIYKYPLLASLRYGYGVSNSEHLYIYLNAAYAAEKKGN